MTDSTERPGGWFRRHKALVIGLLALSLVVVVVAYQIWYDWVARAFAYAPYVNAVFHFHNRLGRLPHSLAELERANNLNFRRVVDLPQAGYPPPLFRALDRCAEGRYLVMIEPRPCRRVNILRWIIYANHDGSAVGGQFVWEWRVAGLIAEDDAKRKGKRGRH